MDLENKEDRRDLLEAFLIWLVVAANELEKTPPKAIKVKIRRIKSNRGRGAKHG